MVDTWKTILNNATRLESGFLSLQHDLNQQVSMVRVVGELCLPPSYRQSTSLAIDYLLPYALNTTELKAQPIYQCLGQDIADVYIETGPQPSIKPTVDRGSAVNPTSPAGSSGSASISTAATSAIGLLAAVAILILAA